ncbi:MAG TPA: beta-propeller fold lactonase family protein [Terriglobales bacterium]|nr:beta-propeller fold lactonase family protein [Terriglobales bacterium]
MFSRTLKFIFFAVSSAALASATTPIVKVTSPAPGSSIGSPVNYVASASSSGCSKGISAIRIYTAPGVNAYTVNANSLNTNINLPKGSYSTVVQAWDNCGGVGKTTVNITVSKINLAPPKFLYATEFKAGKIGEYVVNPLTGSITPTSQGWSWAHWGPVDIASDHWGNYLYVANQGSHDINAYSINRSSGNLTQVSGSPVPIDGIGHRIVVHPSAHFVYVTSTTSTSGGAEIGHINAFSVQSNGSLKPVPGSPFQAQASIPALAMDPLGQYLYASDVSGNAGAVAAYRIDQTTGELTPVPGSPFIVPVGACNPGADFCQQVPTDLGIEPKGKYLYGTLGQESALAGWAIDRSTGALSDLPGSPYPEQSPEGNFCPFNAFGACPDSWTESVDPSGKFVFVADDQFNDISIFKLNQSTGVATYDGSSQNTQDGICVPYTVNVDPSGSFIYNLGSTKTGCSGGTGAVLGFSLNQGNGQMTSVPGSPFANPDVHTTNVSEEKVWVTR